MSIQLTFFQLTYLFSRFITTFLARHFVRGLLVILGILYLSATLYLQLYAQNAQATVISSGLNVRAGPGFNHNVIGTVAHGDVLPVLAQSENCRWLLIRSPQNVEGWVSGKSNYVTLNVSCSAVTGATTLIMQQSTAVQQSTTAQQSSPPANQPTATTFPQTAAPTPTPQPIAPSATNGGSVPVGQGCYLLQNQIGPPVTVTFTNKDSGQSQQIPLPHGAELALCLNAGKYTYTVSVVGYADKNGEFTVVAGDAFYFPIRPTLGR